jgi:methylthioribose-1-phosphate isomerase
MKNFDSLGLRLKDGRLFALDQRKLPQEEHWVECRHPQDMVELIKTLAVRGAPLIGVAAALALGRFAESGASTAEIAREAKALRDARPTAVNLMAAIDRMMKNPARLVQTAEEIFEEDVGLCRGMARHGESLIADGDGVLTHCNTGGLATVGIGTALGVIRQAHESGKKIHVYVDETRPLLQGARLTTWELGKLGIPYTLICDSMAATLMRQGKIQKIFVGADRIAKNGDAANKIGTYSVAVQARHHRVPFYVVAPTTTLDLACPSGDQIPIEQRDADEVRAGRAPVGCEVYNPSFDVTPHELITAIVLDTGLMPLANKGL